MALIQLEEEQIRTWTRAQKDEWWFKNVFRGDMPQLTIRSALTGALLGAVLAATALYIGAKTGITIGVGLTAVILAFALYRIMHAMGVASDFTILENNCTQSIATAAGYMTAPLISSLAAYMLVTGRIIPWWHMVVWMCVVLDHRRSAGVSDEAALHQRGAVAVSRGSRQRRRARRAVHRLGQVRHVQGAAARLQRTARGSVSIHRQRRLDEAAAVQDPAPRSVGRPERAVDVPRAARLVLLRGGCQGKLIYTDDPGHRHPPARAAPDARRRDARHRRPDWHRRRDELPARRIHQLRHPRADHDPGRRHRGARRADRRGGADLTRRDRQSVVTVVGRDDDGGRVSCQPVRPTRDFQGPVEAQEERATGPMC